MSSESANARYIKEAILANISRHKFVFSQDNSEALFTLVLALIAAAKKTFYEKAEVKFSAEPMVEKKVITHFNSCMRIDAMEKFNNPTAFSVLHFYKDAAEVENGDPPSGVLIVYIEKDYVADMLRCLKYPYIDNEDDMEVKDACGTIVNLIAGHFKKEMSLLGYHDLEMSHFKSYINTAVDCIRFPPNESFKYEIVFEIDDKKRMVMEVIMGVEAPEPAVVDQAPVSTSTKKKILVVDDDVTLLKVIKPLLESKGYEVALATDGEEGLNYLSKNKPDLILLDVHMPKMNGYTFLLEIKKVPYLRYTPVIIITAKEGMVEIFKVEGVKEYITKPFQPEMLLEHVRKYV